MPIYLIDMSISDSNHDYSSLWHAMRSAGAQRCLDATWLIDINQDLQTVTDAVSSHCAPGDSFFLVELASRTRWSGTGLSEDVKAWIAHRTVGRKLVPKARQEATIA